MVGNAEALPDQQVEVTGQIVGQVEGRRFGFGHLVESRGRGEELVTMRAGHSDHRGPVACRMSSLELGAQVVDGSSAAAIAIAEEYLFVGSTLLCEPVQPCAHFRRNERRTVMQLRRQALHIDVFEASAADNRLQLVGECTAAEYQHAA